MNQRDAQKLATRRNLSAVAIRLFSEQGYDATRAGDIAAEVGVSERTFFLHFPTKDRSVFPDHDERVAALRSRLVGVSPDTDPLIALAEIVRVGIESTTNSPVRAQRYRLITSIDALRHRDVINDLDYEDVFTEFLTSRWMDATQTTYEMSIKFRARMVASAALSSARSALTTWAAHPTFDPAAAAIEVIRSFRSDPRPKGPR